MAEAVDWLRVVRPRVAVPVHDYEHVCAELACHAFARLSPRETTLLALSTGALPAEI